MLPECSRLRSTNLWTKALTKKTNERPKIRSVSDPSIMLRVALSLSMGDGGAWEPGWGPTRTK